MSNQPVSQKDEGQDVNRHTPGPWTYQNKGFFIYQSLEAVKGQPDSSPMLIAEVYKNENGDLIAAAPDMLAALIELNEATDYAFRPDVHSDASAPRLNAAKVNANIQIAKARGQ